MATHSAKGDDRQAKPSGIYPASGMRSETAANRLEPINPDPAIFLEF